MDNATDYKNFDKFINALIKNYKDQDVHINDNDSLSIIREKDMNFGKIIAGEEILKKWNYFKNKD